MVLLFDEVMFSSVVEGKPYSEIFLTASLYYKFRSTKTGAPPFGAQILIFIFLPSQKFWASLFTKCSTVAAVA